LQSILDVKNCQFQIQLTISDKLAFEVSCAASNTTYASPRTTRQATLANSQTKFGTRSIQGILEVVKLGLDVAKGTIKIAKPAVKGVKFLVGANVSSVSKMQNRFNNI
jgi:hypothetical protein